MNLIVFESIEGLAFKRLRQKASLPRSLRRNGARLSVSFVLAPGEDER